MIQHHMMILHIFCLEKVMTFHHMILWWLSIILWFSIIWCHSIIWRVSAHLILLLVRPQFLKLYWNSMLTQRVKVKEAMIVGLDRWHLSPVLWLICSNFVIGSALHLLSSSVLHQICNKMRREVSLDEVQCHQRHARNQSVKSLKWHSDHKTYFHLIGWKTLFIMCAK